MSNIIGAGKKELVGEVIKRQVKLSFAIIVPLIAVFSLFPQLFIAIYTDIPELIEAAVPSLWVMCASYAVIIPANVYFNSVSGSGNTKTAFGLELIALVVYMVYITITILILRIDVAWAWTSEWVYGAAMFVLCYRYMKSGKWQNRVI